jgi:serine/threonine protein kinase
MDEYIIGKQIGQGAYAVVKVGLHKKSNKKVALKIYEKEKMKDIQRKKSIRREIKLMERLNHPHIAKLYEAIETES